jgi:hypothetical protein
MVTNKAASLVHATPGAGARSSLGESPLALRAQLRAYLAGKTDEGPLLHTLYDHILDEDVPPRLRAVLRR